MNTYYGSASPWQYAHALHNANATELHVHIVAWSVVGPEYVTVEFGIACTVHSTKKTSASAVYDKMR